MAEVDVLIIAALKIEYNAVLNAGLAGQLGDPGVSMWEDQGRETPVPFVQGDYVLANGSRLTMAVARPTRMGGAAIAPVVSSLVERLKPKCLAMSGVCAGNPAEVALGDVVIAEMAYAYDEGARTRDEFFGDHRQIPLSDSWVRTAQDMSTTGLPSHSQVSDDEARIWLLERLYAGDDPRRHPARSRYILGRTWADHIKTLQSRNLIRRAGSSLSLTDEGCSYIEEIIDGDDPGKLPFAIVVGPMASGNVVVKDGVTWEQLARLGVRTVAALDMEAATIAHTAHRLAVPDWVVAKGVMDHADPRKDDRYKPFAARASAEVLFKLLAARLASRPPAGAPHASRLKSVYVIGGITEETDHRDYEESELAQFCHTLGAVIAKAGSDLHVCSPFPDSADFHALRGYIETGVGRSVHLHAPRHPRVEEKETQLRDLLGVEPAKRIKNWYYPGPELDDDPESWNQAWLFCQLMALDRADVVISVGGRVSKSANTILHLAEARQKPVVPFAFLGGASSRAFDRRKWARTYPGLDYDKLRDRDGVVEAMRIADHMVTARMRGAHSYLWPPKKVFVSRARRDLEFEIALERYLSSVGLTVLLGEREWPSNQVVETWIEDAVLRCDLLIVLWSSSYAVSRFCYDELELALQRHRAGELQLWIINLDGSDIVPRGARDLPQAVARTPDALVAVMRDLLDPVLGADDQQ